MASFKQEDFDRFIRLDDVQIRFVCECERRPLQTERVVRTPCDGKLWQGSVNNIVVVSGKKTTKLQVHLSNLMENSGCSMQPTSQWRPILGRDIGYDIHAAENLGVKSPLVLGIRLLRVDIEIYFFKKGYAGDRFGDLAGKPRSADVKSTRLSSK